MLLTKFPNNRLIKLINIIASKDISENLLSLRKLADRGLSIYLDNQVLRVYDKSTDETILQGVYDKPNWSVKFRVNDFKSNENSHCYVMKIATSEGIRSLTQTDAELEKPEGEIVSDGEEELGHMTSEIICMENSADIENMEDLLKNPTEVQLEKSNPIEEGLLWHYRRFVKRFKEAAV